MSEDRLPPLDDESRRFLAAERGRGDVSPELAARIHRGIAAAPGSAPHLRAEPSAPKIDPPRAPLRWRVPAWGIPAALVVGAIAGGLAVRAQRPPPSPPRVTPLPSVSIVIAPPALDPSSPPSTPSPPSVEPSAPASVGSPHRSAAAMSPSAEPKSDTLPRERALLEIARTAFGKRDPRATLAALEQHRREFPSGKLAEERDALMVEALVESGRNAEAKERGAAFKASHPKSILAPAVDDALKSVPQ